MTRLPIRDLVIPKPQPQLTPSLVPAFQSHAQEMVETYIFTDTIRGHFEKILDTVARGHGQAFWIQAEYGAGKTHFLVTLAALLANTGNGGWWQSVQDEQVRLAERRLSPARLFPVVLSLRGQGAGDAYVGRSLLDVLLEEGFQPAITAAGLSGQVQITAAEDILEWLDKKAGLAIHADAEAFIEQRTGQPLTRYREHEGTAATADLLREYFSRVGIRPDIAAGIKARLGHIYRQLTDPAGPGYNGLLVVIDEYEGWQKGHNTPEELSRDAELLETLGFLLPRDLGYQVYTIVASQSPVPAKLQGSQAGDRFINIALLAQSNERDYDIIISRRARGLDENRAPEINDHYDFYNQHFNFAQHLSQAEFGDIFPFQPRCFETIRRVTARDLPTARSGLLVFWEVVNQPDLLARPQLIRLADMMTSTHLVEDCLSKSVYKESYNAYRAASEALEVLDIEPEDLPLAQDILTTLYLWYLAFMEQPRRMTLKELAEATLTTDDILRAEDTVAYVLNSMQVLRQVEFDNQSAAFIPTGGEGPSVVTIFNEHKRRALKDRYKLQSAWTKSLFFTPRETGGASGLFSDFTLDNTVPRRVECLKLEYGGEVLVTSSPRLDLGLPLPRQDIHFRLVFLTAEAVHAIGSADLQDPRIAIVLPGEMTDEVRDAAAAYEAWHSMNEEYRHQAGREAEEIRSWLDTRKLGVYSDLTATHLKLYQAGRILTRDDVGISARDAFGQGGNNDHRIAFIVERLLAAAYPSLPVETDQLRGTLTPSEAGKIFEGYFNKNTRIAETTATRNYGVGLGLSHRDKPDYFAPQPEVTVFKVIEAMLADRQGSDLPVWQIYDKLAGTPYGLPYVLIQLYLLAFVRRANPRVDLLLKANHNLRTRDGQPVSRDRLTASSVPDLGWKTGLENKFDSLVPSAGPQWNDVLPYAREIVTDLKATTDQAEIETQFQRLSRALERLQSEVSQQQQSLKTLAGALNTGLPEPAATAMDTLGQLLAGTPAGYADFYERVEDILNGPETLRDQMRALANSRELTAVAAEISNTKRYLDEVTLRQNDRELAADRLTITAQLQLADLAADPGVWPRLRGDFERFVGRYRNEYQKHHRDYYAAVTRLRESLADAPHRLEALSLLNSIEGLGPASGQDLARRYEALSQQLQGCNIGVTAVNVDYHPACPSCRLPLTAAPPEEDVKKFSRDLDEALKQKTRQLATEAVSRVLARAGRDDMATFLAAVQASDLAALVDVMSPDLAGFINRLLAAESIVTSPTDILARLAQNYLSLEENEIEAVVDQFRQMLEQAFTEAKQANPDKKTIRLTLR